MSTQHMTLRRQSWWAQGWMGGVPSSARSIRILKGTTGAWRAQRRARARRCHTRWSGICARIRRSARRRAVSASASSRVVRTRSRYGSSSGMAGRIGPICFNPYTFFSTWRGRSASPSHAPRRGTLGKSTHRRAGSAVDAARRRCHDTRRGGAAACSAPVSRSRRKGRSGVGRLDAVPPLRVRGQQLRRMGGTL